MARPTTRVRPEPPAPAGPRAIIRDFTGGNAFDVAFDVRTSYDFVFSLSGDCGTTDDIPATDRRWLEASKASLSESLQREMDLLFAADTCVVIAGLAVDRPEITDAATLLDAIRAADTPAVARLLFAEYLRKPELHTAAEAAINGDTSGIDSILGRSATTTSALPRATILRDPVGHPRRDRDGAAKHGSSISGRSKDAFAAMLEHDVARTSGRSEDARARRPHRTDDGRHSLALGAWRPPRHPRAELLREALQLRLRRGRLADVRLPDGRQRARCGRPVRTARLRSSASIARSATRAGCGSFASFAIATGTFGDRRTTRALQAHDQAPPRAAAAAGLVTLIEEGGL